MVSIGYNTMYNLTAGIYSCFSAKKIGERVLSVNHPKKKRDKMEMLFPTSKYNLKSKEFFVLANLYVNFKEGPSSLMGAIDKLRDLDEKKVLKFKNDIVYYKKYLKEDIDRINSEETDINIDYMVKEYRNSKIQWYTFYFYILTSKEPGATMEELGKSRINGALIKKIQKLILYVSFSEESMKEVQALMQDRIAI